MTYRTGTLNDLHYTVLPSGERVWWKLHDNDAPQSLVADGPWLRAIAEVDAATRAQRRQNLLLREEHARRVTEFGERLTEAKPRKSARTFFRGWPR